MVSAHLICGVDEVGRGPLCGPVVAAAVILDPANPIEGLADSKALSAKKRLALEEQILKKALCVSIAQASVEEIDQMNILQASLLAMKRAIEGLKIPAQEAWIDGNKIPKGLAIPATAFVKGDALHACISAASIIAKEHRDRLMIQLDAQYPGYGMAKHAGYPVPEHLKALEQLGVSPIHRASFGPVKRILEEQSKIIKALKPKL